MKRIFIFLLAFFCIVEVEAQGKHKTVNLVPPRPKVGVVLRLRHRGDWPAY